ncbi:MAG: hypothetical protein IJZ89_04460 [Clostridia bacterium]|nr:hypothetical protein [Clostridia bacterium]
MGIFSKLFKPKKEDSKRFRLEMAEMISKKLIRYVTERKDDVEEVIGKSGAFSIRNGEFIVFASSEVIFRTPVEDMRAWELLSGDGAVLTGIDLEHGGVERTITVHYVYYR